MMRLFTMQRAKNAEKKTLPVDKFVAYQVLEDNKLRIGFKGTPFKDGTTEVIYEYDNEEDLMDDLNDLIEWCGK